MIRSYDKPIVIELRFRHECLGSGLKAQKLIAQGNTLGLGMIANNRPERAKALFTVINTLLPFQGVPTSYAYDPGCRFALPWAMRSLPFQGVPTSYAYDPGCRFALPWAMRSLPFQGVPTSYAYDPGCRFALPWAMRSLPFQGVHVNRTDHSILWLEHFAY
ncbi:MAG: hypothetical protein ACI4B3_01175 [Prevotella sp.]